jgi:hypothetical protein
VRPEDGERARVIGLLTSSGAEVYSLEQGYRAEPGGSRQTPGLPDLWVFWPAAQLAGWFEVKSEKGLKEHRRLAQLLQPPGQSQSSRKNWLHVRVQEQFGAQCRQCGVPWAIGTVTEAKAWLVELGFAEVVGNLFTFRRR